MHQRPQSPENGIVGVVVVNTVYNLQGYSLILQELLVYP